MQEARGQAHFQPVGERSGVEVVRRHVRAVGDDQPRDLDLVAFEVLQQTQRTALLGRNTVVACCVRSPRLRAAIVVVRTEQKSTKLERRAMDKRSANR